MSGPSSGGRVTVGGADTMPAPTEFYYSDQRSRAQDLTSISAVTYYVRSWQLKRVRARWGRIPVYANATGQVGAGLAIYPGPGEAKIASGSQQVAANIGDVKLIEFNFGAEHLFDGDYLLAFRALNVATLLQYWGIFKGTLGPIAKAAHGLGYINTGYGLTFPDTAPTWATMLAPTAGFIPFFALTRRDSAQD